MCSTKDLVTVWVSSNSFLDPVEVLLSWSQAPCSEARRNACVSWGMLWERGACNTMHLKAAAAAAKISAIRKKKTYTFWCFIISFGFLKFWLSKTGLMVLVLSVKIEHLVKVAPNIWILQKYQEIKFQSCLHSCVQKKNSLCHIFSSGVLLLLTSN